MVRVKFNNSEAAYNVDFFQMPDNIVQLIGNIPKNTSGFKVYPLNDNFLGDYSDYTKIVVETNNGLQFGKQKQKGE